MTCYKVLLTACMFTMVAGCSNVDNAGDKNKQEGIMDMEQMTNNPRHVAHRFNDRYPERSSNIPLSQPVVSSNTGEDIENVRYVVKMTTPYEAKQIWVNGQTITVSVDSRGKITSNDEWKKEKVRITNLLRNTIPGYDFNVKLDR